MHTIFFKRFFMICLFLAGASGAFAGFPRHSIMPTLGLASTGISDYSLRVSHGLQVSYSSGERMRAPLGIRYQYRMKKGNIFGADLSMVYSPLIVSPQYLSPDGRFGGPSLTLGRMLYGGNLHYSKTIDIKIIEAFGMAGLGGYFSAPSSQAPADGFTWYKDAPQEFYAFAPLVTENALKKFMPVLAFGCGVRFRHLEAGLQNQISLTGPVSDFTYNGFAHTLPLGWKSIGYYVGYRFEF